MMNRDAALAEQSTLAGSRESSVAWQAPGTTGAAAEHMLSDMLNSSYHRALLQILATRNVSPDVAADLIKIACGQISHEICAQHLQNQTNVQEQLYRLACGLAVAYWQGELNR
jgi:hypothetical protein